MPKDLFGWYSAAPLATPFQYSDIRSEVVAKGPNEFNVSCGENSETIILERWEDNFVIYRTTSGRKTLHWHLKNPAEIYIQQGAESFHLTNSLAIRRAKEKAGGEGEIIAPLHGALTEIFVSAGDEVKIGTRLAVIEAMKMQHDIVADMDGTVSDIFAEAGSQIAANAPLFKLTS